MTEVASLIDEHCIGRPRSTSLNKLSDTSYVLGDTFNAPEHHRQLARHRTELDTVAEPVNLNEAPVRGVY
jgi:hypothetical protein